MEECNIKNCKNTRMATKLWDGKIYCEKHYGKIIWKELINQYNNWNADEQGLEKFRHILSRVYHEGFFKNLGESYLSQARIRDRSFNYLKTENGCTFEITRHLNSWDGLGKRKDVVEIWEVDIEKKTFVLVKTRKFKKGDYDSYKT